MIFLSAVVDLLGPYLGRGRTCFWAGDTFSPRLIVKNGSGREVSIQTLLQDAFLDMFDKLVEAVGDLDSVIGFEVCAHDICSNQY